MFMYEIQHIEHLILGNMALKINETRYPNLNPLQVSNFNLNLNSTLS